MAMLTKSTLISQMQAELGDGQNQSADNTIYGQWVDECIQTIWNEWKWPEKRASMSVSVSAGSSTFSVDNTFSQVWGIVDVDDDTLKHYNRDEFLDAHLDLSLTSDKPEVWYWADYDKVNNQRQIGLWRVPSEAITLTVYGWLRPDVTIDDADTIPLPEEFIPAMKEYMRFRSNDAEELHQNADRAYRQFEMRLRTVKRLLAKHDPGTRNRRRLDADLKQFSGYRSYAPVTWPDEIPH